MDSITVAGLLCTFYVLKYIMIGKRQKMWIKGKKVTRTKNELYGIKILMHESNASFHSTMTLVSGIFDERLCSVFSELNGF